MDYTQQLRVYTSKDNHKKLDNLPLDPASDYLFFQTQIFISGNASEFYKQKVCFYCETMEKSV